MSPDAQALLRQLHLDHAAAGVAGLAGASGARGAWPTRISCGACWKRRWSARASEETERRLRQANFPFAATIEQFDFRFRPELKRQVILRYLDPTFVEQAGTLTLIGPPGLGQDHAGDLHRHQAGAARLHGPLHHRPEPGGPTGASTHCRWPAAGPAPAAEL